jgi:hypothetical protein
MKEIILYNYLYDASAANFIAQLEAYKDDDVVIRMNTGGGSPESTFGMIAKISESTITIGSQISVTSWNYELDENNNLVLKLEEGQEEKCEIKKLTETEFIFSEGEVGNFYLVRTDEELPAVVAPVEEEPLEEPMIYNIETDYKASKKTGKLLQHKWDVLSVSGQPAPEGVTLSIEFKTASGIDTFSDSKAFVKNVSSLFDGR